MLGFVLGLLYGLYLYLTKNSGYQIYSSVLVFLHPWYIWTTVLMAVVAIVALIWATVRVSAVGGVVGSRYGSTSRGGVIGTLLGFFGMSTLSVLVLVFFAVVRGCLILGTMFLSQALTMGPTPAWDTSKLIIGGILMFVGLFVFKNSSSSSSRH